MGPIHPTSTPHQPDGAFSKKLNEGQKAQRQARDQCQTHKRQGWLRPLHAIQKVSQLLSSNSNNFKTKTQNGIQQQ
jgi:hypothetical protein